VYYMSHLKTLILISLISSVTIFGQSLLDAYGFGSTDYSLDAASLGNSSIGMSATYQPNISLLNPSTWHNMTTVYLHGSYRGHIVEFSENRIENSNSAPSIFRFIVPIKNSFAFGIGLHPITTQRIRLEDIKENQTLFDGDTLSYKRSIKASGGLAAFNFALNFPLGLHESAALAFDVLFGSNRHENIIGLNSTNYFYQRQNIFSGTTAKIYVTSDRLNESKYPVTLYGAFGFTIQPLRIRTYWYEPFEDSNDNEYQDNSDFPRLINSDAPKKKFTYSNYAPIEFRLGSELKVNSEVILSGEVMYWKDNSEPDESNFIILDWVNQQSHLSLGITKFKKRLPQTLYDKLTLRSGLFYKNLNFQNDPNGVKEFGLSLGVGFNFGLTKNQIDIGYTYGKRTEINSTGDELFHKISVGISIGDYWFRKRRIR